MDTPDSTRLPDDTPKQSSASLDTDPAFAQDARRAEIERAKTEWEKRQEAEKADREQRRAVAFGNQSFAADVPVAGLALSGGGIRSATFCFGLIQALASNGLLRRFDYLSTVSGGGYLGAAVGRLVQHIGIDRAETQLGKGDSQILSWLRKNGRYLTPSGSRDIGLAIATVLRSTLSTHFEVGLVAVLFALMVILPHAMQVQYTLFDGDAWSHWHSVWWPLAAAFWLLTAPGCIAVFWPLRDPIASAPSRLGERWTNLVVALVAFVGCLFLNLGYSGAQHGWIGEVEVSQLGLLVAFSVVVWAIRVETILLPLRKAPVADVAFQVNELRNRLTRRLRLINAMAAGAFLLGAIDALSFAIPSLSRALSLTGGTLSAVIAAVGASVVALRSASEPIQKALSSQKAMPLNTVINLVGLGMAAVLVFAWTTLLQWMVFFDSERFTLFKGASPLWCIAALIAMVLLWMLKTYRNREAVNASTLHGFYRSRLIRAYISVGNVERFRDIEKPTLGSIEASSQSVTDVIRGDDIALADYRPEQHGGPVHLITTTLNQTVDDHGDLYNADRKGIAAVVSAGGIEVGPAEAASWPPDGNTTLGQWITISGAAAAPGAGSNTSRGWALLLFFFGVRLGYWVGSLMSGSANVRAHARHPAARAMNKLFDTKSGLFYSEAVASFFGRPSKWWYLSDGGHFENLGVYALIKREMPFILVADCGADPTYSFEDLEGLIRKARIDFDAQIEVYTKDEAEKAFGTFDAELGVLLPNEFADNHTQRGILLARICYRCSDPQRRHFGTLVLVKPNLHQALDRDVLGYASRNSSFPQQSTADQFFDEAQWESYRRLGYDVGRALTDERLSRLPNWKEPAAPAKDFAALRHLAKRDGTVKDDVPFWRRESTAATLRTTFNVSLLTTLIGIGWTAYTAYDKQRKDSEIQRNAQVEAAAKEARDLQGNLDRLTGRLCSLSFLSGQNFCTSPSPSATSGSPAPSGSDLTLEEGQELGDVFRKQQKPELLRLVPTAHARIVALQEMCKPFYVQAGECGLKSDAPANLCTNLCESQITTPPADAYWGKPDKCWDDDNGNVFALWWMWVRVHALHHQAPAPGACDAVAAAPGEAPPAAPQAAPVGATAPTDVPTAPPTKEYGDTAGVLKIGTGPNARILAQAGIPTGADPTTPAPVADDVFKSCQNEGKPIVVYTQVYDEAMARTAADIAKHYAAPGFVAFARVENVAKTAAALNKPIPGIWSQPTLIVHRPGIDTPCAQDIANQLAGLSLKTQVRDLPATLGRGRHVLELWLPPSAAPDSDKAAAPP